MVTRPFFNLVVFAVLEWVLIALLFVDGFIAFAAHEFARLFGLRPPCLFCTRIDRVFVHREHNFHFNASLCGAHKREVSSLAYCHSHSRVSDIRRMCEACLLSFANADAKKSTLAGINLQKDLEDDDLIGARQGIADEANEGEKGDEMACSCCGEMVRKKAKSGVKGRVGVLAGPAPSPRAMRFSMKRRGSEIRLFSENETEVVGDGVISTEKLREDVKAAMMHLLAKDQPDEQTDADANKTPNILRSNRFFGIPLTDSASNTPRLTSRLSKKSPLEKTELASEPQITDPELSDSVLQGLRKQVRLDSSSLTELYIELDEERSAAAIAANNAMAMITRLQAEKARLQMEALQYQRVMEEQFEYDQEALQEANDLLMKRDDDVRALQEEIEAYREQFGALDCHVADGDSPEGAGTEALKDFKEEKTYILGMKKVEPREDSCEDGVDSSEFVDGDDEIDKSST